MKMKGRLQGEAAQLVGDLDMKMKLFAAATVAVGLLAVASSASASTTITQNGESVTIDAAAVAFAPNLTASGFTMIDDFDSAVASGFAVSGGTLATGTSGTAAAPPGDLTQYEAVEPGHDWTLTDTNGSLTAFSFYMGSPDDFNGLTLKVDGGLGPIILSGAQIWGNAPPPQPGPGNQVFGFLVTYTFAPNTVHSLTLSSTNPAFEIDNVAGISVPEPASWALMIGGFGLAGATLRANRRKAALA